MKDGYDWVANINKLTDNINKTIIDKIGKTPEMFKVSKIVEPLIKNNEAHYEVAWKGYRKKSDNTIEPREQLLKDILFL